MVIFPEAGHNQKELAFFWFINRTQMCSIYRAKSTRKTIVLRATLKNASFSSRPCGATLKNVSFSSVALWSDLEKRQFFE